MRRHWLFTNAVSSAAFRLQAALTALLNNQCTTHSGAISASEGVVRMCPARTPAVRHGRDVPCANWLVRAGRITDLAYNKQGFAQNVGFTLQSFSHSPSRSCLCGG